MLPHVPPGSPGDAEHFGSVALHPTSFTTIPTLMRRSFAFAALLLAGPLFLLAGCDAADPSTASDFDLPAANAAAKLDVCHYTPRTDTYDLRSITIKSLLRHLSHGDIEPGTNGLDENCQPAAPGPLEACLEIGNYAGTYDLDIDPDTGAITGIGPFDAPLTGDVTDPSGAVGSAGDIQAFDLSYPFSTPDGLNVCFGVGGPRSEDGTFALAITQDLDCDGSVEGTDYQTGTLTAGACQ